MPSALALAVAFYPTNALVAVVEPRRERAGAERAQQLLPRGAHQRHRLRVVLRQREAGRQPARCWQRNWRPTARRSRSWPQGKMDRFHAARPDGLGKLNVVVVSSESFGAEFSKLHGSTRDWTPNFDAYAQQGLWFANTYASGTRTVRGLEAITPSFPPIPTVSILRRPGNQGIGSWGKVMNELGYQSSFLYGGYGYFDDMNAFFAGNGFQVLDRTDIDKRPLRERLGRRRRRPVRPRNPALRRAVHGRQAVLLDHHDDVEPQAVHVPSGPRATGHPAGGRRPRRRACATPTTRSATSCARPPGSRGSTTRFSSWSPITVRASTARPRFRSRRTRFR